MFYRQEDFLNPDHTITDFGKEMLPRMKVSPEITPEGVYKIHSHHQDITLIKLNSKKNYWKLEIIDGYRSLLDANGKCYQEHLRLERKLSIQKMYNWLLIIIIVILSTVLLKTLNYENY